MSLLKIAPLRHRLVSGCKDKISAVMSISDRKKFNSENTKWFFSNFRGRIILSEFKVSSRSRRFNISSTNEFVPVQPESKQGRWGYFGHFLAEKMQAKCFSRNLGSEKEYFGIAECNGKLKETEQQNRGKEIVSLLEVGLWNRTTMYFSQSQGVFLNLWLCTCTNRKKARMSPGQRTQWQDLGTEI